MNNYILGGQLNLIQTTFDQLHSNCLNNSNYSNYFIITMNYINQSPSIYLFDIYNTITNRDDIFNILGICYSELNINTIIVQQYLHSSSASYAVPPQSTDTVYSTALVLNAQFAFYNRYQVDNLICNNYVSYVDPFGQSTTTSLFWSIANTNSPTSKTIISGVVANYIKNNQLSNSDKDYFKYIL